MRQTLLTLTLICLFAFSSQSQSNYASIWVAYPPGYELSSGFATKYKPGYFWIGSAPRLQNINTTWYINKNFSILGAGPSSMSVSYKVYDSQFCNGPLAQVLNGNGVSAIETSGTNGCRYAVAGSYDKACYFTSIDSIGNVLAAVSYPFPYPPSGLYAAPSKPIIIEAQVPGEFYITGSFESKMYVIKVNSAGTILWSSFYSLGLDVQVKDILLDTYAPGNFVVVGQATTVLLNKQGFFMRISDSGGNVIMSKTFGDYGAEEGFETIIEASPINPSGTSGFIVGGKIRYPNNLEKPWILKITAQGNIIWSHLPVTSLATEGSVVDVIERLNTLNTYEYYALLNSDAGLHVLKLDNSGQPFPISSPNALHNEFAYDLLAPTPAKATSISYIDNAVATSDVGIQVFGTSSYLPGFSSSYVVSLYFNGQTNCSSTLTTMQGVEQGPQLNYPEFVISFGRFNACTNFQVQSFIIGAAVNFPCSGFVSAGSNQRSISTNLEQEENNTLNFSVFPNPTEGKLTINYTASNNSNTNISVYNLVGELVMEKIVENKSASSHQEEIDLSELDLAKGIYIATCSSDGKTHKQKIVYTN